MPYDQIIRKTMKPYEFLWSQRFRVTYLAIVTKSKIMVKILRHPYVEGQTRLKGSIG